MNKTFRLGRCFFALAVIASGILQLVRADFVRLVPKAPVEGSWHSFLACLVGVVLVAVGSAMLTGKFSRAAATLLAILLLLMLVMLYAPQVAANPKAGFMWTNPCKTLALVGGALLLARTPAGEKSRERPANGKAQGKLALLATIFLGVFFLIGGIQHFVYADFVDTLVPKWLPALRFWTYFAGIALIAGGLGIFVPKTARWAATLSALMIFLWVVLLHIPRALADLHNAGEMAGVFEALALSGVALMVAATHSRG